jgi:hypothetical protein
MWSSQICSISIARRAKTEQPRASALGLRTKVNRPEGAAARRVLFPKITLVESDSIRTPFQGDYVACLVPRAEALGCSLFALRAIEMHMRKCVGVATTPPME